MTSNWRWIQQSENGGIDASALGKLFRNRTDGMGAAELLAREAIQNSADAARDYRKGGTPFKMRFHFKQYTGTDKHTFMKAFASDALAERLTNVKWQEDLTPITLPFEANSSVPLEVLYIEDFGAHGLRGPKHWMSDSDLFNAIYMVGTSNKRPDAGGSFGFGKAAVFNAGAFRSIYAYSCFEPGYKPKSNLSASVSDAASRRAVGFLYWKSHVHEGQFYDGRAEYADSKTNAPFEDGAADDIAIQWGITPRNPQDKEEHGTSFAVVAPRVSPEDLLKAVELYWWPAIIDRTFGLDVEILTADGRRLIPDVAHRKDLKTYIDTFSIALNGLQTSLTDETGVLSTEEAQRLRAQGPWRPDTGSRPQGITPGNLGVIMPAESELAEDYTPVIARIRSTRMVIDYQRLDGRSRISLPLRSTYVASEAEDPLLRKTEDAGHAGWAERGDPPNGPYELAASISAGIREALRDICAIATPKSEDREIKAAMIGKLLALPGRGASTDSDHDAPRFLIKNLRGERTINSSDQSARIIGTFTVQAAAQQAKRPTSKIHIELNAKYSSESDDPERLPYILSAARTSNASPRPDGAIEMTLKRGEQAHLEYSIPGLQSSRTYGVTVEPVVTIIE